MCFCYITQVDTGVLVTQAKEMLRYIRSPASFGISYRRCSLLYILLSHSPSTKYDHNKIYINTFTLVFFFCYICTINTKILKCLYEVCVITGFCVRLHRCTQYQLSVHPNFPYNPQPQNIKQRVFLNYSTDLRRSAWVSLVY